MSVTARLESFSTALLTHLLLVLALRSSNPPPTSATNQREGTYRRETTVSIPCKSQMGALGEGKGISSESRTHFVPQRPAPNRPPSTRQSTVPYEIQHEGSDLRSSN